MPLYGIIKDSPWIYAGQKLARSLRRSGSRRTGSFGTTYFKYTVANVVIFKNILDIELNTPAGGLWKHLEVRGRKAVRDAKGMVGVKTGALKKSIHMKHLGNSTGQYLWIGSQKSYALAHHEGTRPRIIIPNPPRRMLVFRKGSRIIATPRVIHPGTKPNPYLSTQLRHFID
jgi:hypothetical protein